MICSSNPFKLKIKYTYGLTNKDFVKELIEIVNENKIMGIVIGNPINMDGSSNQSSQSARDLAINLSKDITENITMWDERLSSEGAFKITKKLGSNTSNKVKNLDKNAAAFILCWKTLKYN